MDWFVGLLIVVALALAVAWAINSAKQARRPARKATYRDTRRQTSTPSSHPVQTPARAVAKKPNVPVGYPITWFGRDAELEVGGFRLKGPCVYASSVGPGDHYREADPSEIMVRAPVRRPVAEPRDMGYWPWYSRIEPEHRFTYLSWLASGRTSLPPKDGYLFLYFYGIERRLLVDEADRVWGLQEVVRLRRLDEPRAGTRDGASFRQYSTGFLWFEIARTPHLFERKSFDLVISLTENWTPELLSAPLAWLVAKDVGLPAALARYIASTDPSSQRSVVLKRVGPEFEDLFDTRYRDTFGAEGLKLRVSTRPTWHTYRPASGGLGPLKCQVANPLGIKSQFRSLPDIWNSCITDLRKLSRVASVGSDRGVTVEAWEAMPKELQAEVEHPLADRVSAIVAASATQPGEAVQDASGIAFVAAGTLAELLGVERRPALTATQSQRLASTIEATGYGLVPDARIAGVRYGWDELLALVPGLDDKDTEPTRYNAAACVLRLGMSIAHADGEVDEVELRTLSDHIDAVFGLTPAEQQRLATLRLLLLRTGSDIRPIVKRLQELLPPDARRKVGRMLVVIAATTNGIDRSERAALRKAFRALDLEPETLEAAITEVAPESGESEIQVRGASSGSDEEPIPSPTPIPTFKLDHVAISGIMTETRDVAALLAAAMDTGDHDEDQSENARPTRSSDLSIAPRAVPAAVIESELPMEVVSRLDTRYRAFLAELATRDSWERSEAELLARSHKLMLDAATEAINDWAYDVLGAPVVIDDGPALTLDQSLVKELDGMEDGT